MSRAMGKDVQAPCQLMGVELVEKKKKQKRLGKKEIGNGFLFANGK
jgi:hypothetical protein